MTQNFFAEENDKKKPAAKSSLTNNYFADDVDISDNIKLSDKDLPLTDVYKAKIGCVIDKRYKIIDFIGAGGMSCVYKACHEITQKIVALKLMHKHIVNNPQSIRRFQQEATAASRLNHQNIINIFDVGQDEDATLFMVMDFIEGESLSDLIKTLGKIPVESAINIFKQIASALDHAHNQGVVHRDIKPSNIMVFTDPKSQETTVKLVDFGIAKLLPNDDSSQIKLTQTGEVFGSPLYMSPEQCTGQDLDQRSDIYSFGCIMYEALTGNPPLLGNNMLETMYKQINENPASLSGINASPQVIEKLDGIIFKAMAKDVEKRYSSCHQIYNELTEIENISLAKFDYIIKAKLWINNLLRFLFNYTKRYPFRSIFVLTIVFVVFIASIVYSYYGDCFVKIPENKLEINLKSVLSSKTVSKDEMFRNKDILDARSGMAEKFIGDDSIEFFESSKDQADLLFKYNQFDQAKNLYENAIKAAKVIHNEHSKDACEIYSNLAKCYLNLKDYAKACENACITISLYTNLDQSGMRSDNWEILEAYSVLLYAKAKLLQESKDAYQRDEFHQQLINNYNIAKELYQKIVLNDKLREWRLSGQKADYVCSNLNLSLPEIAENFGKLALICFENNDTELSYNILNDLALPLYDRLNNSSSQNQYNWLYLYNLGCLNNELGLIELHRKNYEVAKQKFNESLKLFTDSDTSLNNSQKQSLKNDLSLIDLALAITIYNKAQSEWITGDMVASIKDKIEFGKLYASNPDLKILINQR